MILKLNVRRLYTRLGAGILILALLAAPVPGAAGARSVAPEAAPSALEEDLVAELLALNLDIMQLRQERQARGERLADLRRSIRTRENDLARAQAELARVRDRLGERLCFHYEQGRWSYLEALLGTGGFRDFCVRLELFELLIEQETGLYKEVRELNRAIGEQIGALEVLRAEARREQDRTRRQLAAMERTKARRVALLEEVRLQSGALADRIESMEQEWQASLKPLRHVLGQLNVLLVRELKPDRISFEGAGVRLEVGADAVNRALRSVRGRPGDRLAVALDEDEITIRGRSAAGASEFTLTGQLVPRARGSAVYFLPRSLTVNGKGIEPALLPALNRDGGLSFTLGQRYRHFSIRQIRHAPGKVVVILQRA